MKGETAEEISACAEGMRSFATKLDRGDMDVIDIVGTGGDRSNTFNISTTAAIVTAAAGVAVAKHGNRAASSKCGTADCLETLGVNLMLEPEKNAKVLKDTNLCFLFAQKYHPAMRYVGPVRKAIGVPTVFNILGPLTNPAYNTYQLLGVYSEELLDTVANALKDLGLKHAMVVYGKDCLDEISMSADGSHVNVNLITLAHYFTVCFTFGCIRVFVVCNIVELHLLVFDKRSWNSLCIVWLTKSREV
jgi:anthranilate phosphoribosyltransferase